MTKMMFISKTQVPEYLRSGTTYRTMSSDKVEIPDLCCKADLSIESVEDLCHLMHSLRYWKVSKMPVQGFGYLMKRADQTQSDALALGFPEHLHLFVKVFNLKKNQSLHDAIKLCLGVEYVRFLHDFCGYATTPSCWVIAAEVGDVPTMKFLASKAVPKEKDGFDTVIAAACYGNHECLRYMHDQGWSIHVQSIDAAAKFGRLECIKFLHEVCGLACTNVTMMYAGELGQMIVIQYLHDVNCPWDIRLCALLASKGYCECLMLAHALGCPWDERAYHAALRAGDLRCLSFVHEKFCPLDKTSMLHGSVLTSQHRACLLYAYKYGCPIPDLLYPSGLFAVIVASSIAVHFWYGMHWIAVPCQFSAWTVFVTDVWGTTIRLNRKISVETLNKCRRDHLRNCLVCLIFPLFYVAWICYF